MLSKDYENRFLKQHNISTGSPASSSGGTIAGTAPTTPTKKRVTGDRFIPIRSPDNWDLRYQPKSVPVKIGPQRVGSGAADEGHLHESAAYRALLKNELLNYSIQDIKEMRYDGFPKPINDGHTLFKYQLNRTPSKNDVRSPYSMSPISPQSQKLLRSPRKAVRKIQKVPFKVLDAPELQDDFYLNLVDWSSQNILAVGLGATVYLWSARTSEVTKLCDLSDGNDTVTSVGWADKGHLLAVGTNRGYCQIWNAEAKKQVMRLDGHSNRLGCLAWNGDVISSGSRDRSILQQDIRSSPSSEVAKLIYHTQEVCGLKWSTDGQYLASGGNDNKLLVWAQNTSEPVQVYNDHQAAVKAIAWSPHHSGLLASGGGTADRHIRFWNTLTGQAMRSEDTGSQVCNVAWSKHSSELVSTHGYSQNQIIVWKYPSMQQMAKLTGHSYRVLYLAMSPEGESIVTGAGDETLRFWNVFNKRKQQRPCKSALNLFTSIR
jgi:cell division cycle 20-like protein 1 (cofactor of APC complex)